MLKKMVVAFGSAAFFTLSQFSDGQGVQRWIHPGYGADGSDPYNAAFLDEQQYITALQTTDVFQFFADAVNNMGQDANLKTALAARIAIFKKYGIRISVEGLFLNPAAGVFNGVDDETPYCQKSGIVCGTGPGEVGPEQLGVESARITLRKIQPIYDAAGEVSYLSLDGSAIDRLMRNGTGPGSDYGCHFSVDEAVTTLISFMQTIHAGVGAFKGRPDIKIGITTNFPNVRYAGIPSYHNRDEFDGNDFRDVLAEMVRRVKESGETLWWVHADSPYNYTVPVEYADGTPAPNQGVYDYFARLLSLKAQAQALGLRFGVEFNTDRGSAVTYTNETLGYIRRFKQAAGDPDDFMVENWYNIPQTFPESVEYTFMNLVKKIADPSRYETWGTDHRFSRQLDTDIFDWQFYFSLYSDVRTYVAQNYPNQQRFGTEKHWLSTGVPGGRRGSWLFSATYYLNKYPDITAAYGATNYAGAIDHYFVYGRNEGRLARVPRLSAGSQHGIVQGDLRELWASGSGADGQLGNGATTNRKVPVAVSSQWEPTDVASGWYNSLAVTRDGRVYTWGSNQYGQLGNGTVSTSPTSIPQLVNQLRDIVTQTGDGKHIVSSNFGVCAAVDKYGQMWMWGINYDGQLGDGTTSPHYLPKRVLTAPSTPLTGVISVAAGSSHTAALRSDGTVWAWGTGDNGALGNGSTTRKLYPAQVITASGAPLTNVKQVVSGGSRFSLALKQNGDLWGWGANDSGQLGVGDLLDRPRAVFIRGGVDRIAAGDYHALCHSNTDGHVWAWGYNGWGQLGNPNAAVGQTSPIQMREDNGMTNITDVAAGGDFSLMIRAGDEKVFGVGDNQCGQLGVNDLVGRNIPVLTRY